MYSINSNTGKIFLTDGMVEVLPNTSERDVYVGWLKLGNTPVETNHETSEDIVNTMTQVEFSKYLQRIEDGKVEYMKISAEFRTAKKLGQLDEATHAVIEDTLKPVRNEVLAGQWIDARKELEKIDPATVGQSLYDRLHLQLSEYITENYD